MTFYQELQLNQAGSKAVIRNSQEKKDKFKHILIYLFKIFITVAFSTVFDICAIRFVDIINGSRCKGKCV